MKLVIGLGNPGEKYKNNRHNVGHMVIDKLKTQKSKVKNTILAKTDTFMNGSGSFVESLYTKYDIPNTSLYIVHDDLDLPLGTWKIQFAKGPRDHGGINDIEQKLGTKNFYRVRVGVDNRKPESGVLGEEYVLQDFTGEEKKIVDRAANEVCKKLATISRNTN